MVLNWGVYRTMYLDLLECNFFYILHSLIDRWAGADRCWRDILLFCHLCPTIEVVTFCVCGYGISAFSCACSVMKQDLWRKIGNVLVKGFVND